MVFEHPSTFDTLAMAQRRKKTSRRTLSSSAKANTIMQRSERLGSVDNSELRKLLNETKGKSIVVIDDITCSVDLTAMVGAGVLGLPYAVSQLGWGPGAAVLILSWVITLYTLWQMVEMHEMVPGKRFDSYSTVAWVLSWHKGVQPDVQYTSRASTNTGQMFDSFSALGDIAFAFAGHSVALEIQATIPSTPGKPSKKPMWKGVVVAYLVPRNQCVWKQR
ncbi:hypothetical protein POTOM_016597 [Populus tomentosa]|uniref:Amino acid transporter transmembrane domain-containing protein n=1 Tax=Populus tomentosa TaxID=118781 RepID=A0A8X8D5S6_POPTO|nr:hypothetical protein POTOM_016597 [Populus tomentosa]